MRYKLNSSGRTNFDKKRHISIWALYVVAIFLGGIMAGTPPREAIVPAVAFFIILPITALWAFKSPVSLQLDPDYIFIRDRSGRKSYEWNEVSAVVSRLGIDGSKRGLNRLVDVLVNGWFPIKDRELLQLLREGERRWGTREPEAPRRRRRTTAAPS